ncbi:MAG: peptidylprolyl isomerase [Pseudomonadota bacterium]
MKLVKTLGLALLIVVQTDVLANKKDLGASVQPDNYYPKVKFATSMGDITVELDRKRAPITVNNFLRYTKLGQYDNTVFHRVVFDYIVQGGGYSPEFEEKTEFSPIFNESGNGLKNNMYTIAMARMDDPHSAKRQFFFNAKDNDNLNPGKTWGYTVFGLVVEGQSVIDEMAIVDTDYNIEARFYDVPVNPIVLEKVTILPQ